MSYQLSRRNDRRRWLDVNRFTSRLWLGLIVISLAGPSFAFESCNAGPRLYTDSPSCYTQVSTERPNAGRFDLSKETFEKIVRSLKDNIIPADSKLYYSLPTILEKVADFPSYKIFLYYDNDNDNKGNTDCNLHSAVSRVVGDTSTSLNPPIGGGNCDNESYHFAQLYKHVTGSQQAKLVGPFEKLIYIQSADKDVAKEYADTRLDQWYLFNRRFGGTGERLAKEFPELEPIKIPTWTYVNPGISSLSAIVKEFAKGRINWEIVWDMNRESLPNPLVVEKNKPIILPLGINFWDKFIYSGQTPEGIAIKYYDDKTYAAMVSKLIDVIPLQKDNPETLYLPVFEQRPEIRPASISSFDVKR